MRESQLASKSSRTSSSGVRVNPLLLRTTSGDWRYTALFSNAAHAHQSNKPHDWLAIYYDGWRGERQCAVITAERGLIEGRRIVRGREGEFSASYFSGEVAEGDRGDSELRALIYPASRVYSQCARNRKLGEANATNAQPRGNPPLKRRCVR